MLIIVAKVVILYISVILLVISIILAFKFIVNCVLVQFADTDHKIEFLYIVKLF